MLKTKRDARHYFFQLRLPKVWRKFMAWPPVKDAGGDSLYPRATCAPMGFAPSAGWAQLVTNAATKDLPAAQRVDSDEVMPCSWPVWGSIVDDVWAIEEAPGDQALPADEPDRLPDSLGDPATWLCSVEERWNNMKVEINAKKSVDADENAEIQGATLHPTAHWLGVGVQRRLLVMDLILRSLVFSWMRLRFVEVIVGKAS